ncbi:cysteine synthase B [Aspergillus luchuensis]|uniref:Cysteine synthase B n=1 Tax=Aspergillus kawachii TaxID=1069201 RepID=A0A146FLP3_ASPKA|nr:cysteine synthase B [Aspergillus luchuensis]
MRLLKEGRPRREIWGRAAGKRHREKVGTSRLPGPRGMSHFLLTCYDWPVHFGPLFEPKRLSPRLELLTPSSFVPAFNALHFRFEIKIECHLVFKPASIDKSGVEILHREHSGEGGKGAARSGRVAIVNWIGAQESSEPKPELRGSR